MFTSAGAYDRFVGRYGPSLSQAHIEAAGVEPDHRVLDVGCGPGTLTKALADRVGAGRVAAVDPSPEFVEACRERVPGADVRVAPAEDLPRFEEPFDTVLSQLVVNFLANAEAGVQGMRGAVRPGGVVASCVWDYAQGMTMLRAFWDAALELDDDAPDESRTMAHCNPDALAALWTRCELEEVETAELRAEASYQDFDDLWASFLAGVGPAGAYCASLDARRRDVLRERFRSRLRAPAGPFTLTARAWFVRGRAP
jgi:SAM-dependent methyltransferase